MAERAAMTNTEHDAAAQAPVDHLVLGARSALGGLLMGLANLVPGVSGGTMLLAAGVYPRFVRAVAEVTTLRFRPASVLVLGVVTLAALLAILIGAGLLRALVVDHRWVMYSLFIGLTLGGVPVVWWMARPATAGTWAGAACGFAAMAALVWVQHAGLGTGGGGAGGGFVMMLLAGTAAASAMILPGVSGGYLLLVLGVYLPILRGIEELRDALGSLDLGAMGGPIVSVVLPVGIGVVVGVAVVSNAVRLLLNRFEKPTLGVLLGLLVGAVVGLWPFQHGAPPEVGDVVRGQPVTERLLATLDPADYPMAFFEPTAGQVLAALGLIAGGFAITLAIGWVGGWKGEGPPRSPSGRG